MKINESEYNRILELAGQATVIKEEVNKLQKLLIQAVDRNAVKIFTELLKRPEADPSGDNGYLLMLACQNGQEEIVELILNHPKFFIGNTTVYKNCIDYAQRIGNDKIVKMLHDAR